MHGLTCYVFLKLIQIKNAIVGEGGTTTYDHHVIHNIYHLPVTIRP